MGNCGRKKVLDPEVAKKLREYFDPEELDVMYKKFLKSHPEGYVVKQEFNFHMSLMELGDDFFAETLFDLFSRDSGGKLGFPEFIKLLHSVTKGTTEQKLEVVFKIYNVSGTGKITIDEIMNISEAMHKLIPDLEEKEVKENYFQEIFRRYRVPEDGMSLDIFKNVVRNEPKFLKKVGYRNV